MNRTAARIWERLIWKYLPTELRVIRRRKHGLALIRSEAIGVVRDALKALQHVDARWQSDPDWVASPVVEDSSHVLAFDNRIQATAQFPDWVVSLYPDDPESVRQVEDELRRLSSSIRSSG